MWTKRVLLWLPALIVLVLAQSFFWVPTYESQLLGNPERSRKLVEASIGDARILNPILNADSSSSKVVGLVFDGLLDLDEDLELRGRLAQSWRIEARAYVAAVPGATLPDGRPATGAALLAALREALADGSLAELADSVQGLALEAPHTRTLTLALESGAAEPKSGEVSVAVPARVRLDLASVDQDLAARLGPVLGADYGRAWQRAAAVQVPGAEGGLPTAAALAGALPVVEMNPVITFELRRDVRFHDGHAFDAQDVRFTYESIMAARNLSPRTSDFEPIAAVTVLTPHRVEVVYKRPFSPAINAWTIGILPEHLLNEARLAAEAEARGLSPEARARFAMRDASFNRAPVGTGPFVFEAWDSDELIHLRRNPDAWDRPPMATDYYFRVIPDLLTQELEFRTGAIDIYAPQPHQVARYRRDPRYRAYSTPSRGYTYIGYNNDRPPLDDPRVRRALGMAIDVEAIIAYVLYGEADPVTGPFPRNTPWYDPDLEPLAYDPEAARATLEMLGWRSGEDGWLYKDGKRFELNLISNNGNPVRKAALTIAQASWARIGVKANTQLFEWAVFLEDFVNPSNFDAVVLGWSMGIDHDLYQIWHSSQVGFAKLNFVGYRSAVADGLMERLRREYDRERQVELAHALHRQIAADQPYTFLFAPRGTQVLDRKLVMVGDDGQPTPLRAARSGDLYYFLDRWYKAELSARDGG